MRPDAPSTDSPRAAAAGLPAGLVASAVMNGFQAARTAASDNGGPDEEPTTTKAADRLAEAATGERVPEPYRKAADWRVTARFGMAFGLGTAAVLDEGLVPALGLAPKPAETPPAPPPYASAPHLVFGLALEAARLALRGR